MGINPPTCAYRAIAHCNPLPLSGRRWWYTIHLPISSVTRFPEPLKRMNGGGEGIEIVETTTAPISVPVPVPVTLLSFQSRRDRMNSPARESAQKEKVEIDRLVTFGGRRPMSTERLKAEGEEDDGGRDTRPAGTRAGQEPVEICPPLYARVCVNDTRYSVTWPCSSKTYPVVDEDALRSFSLSYEIDTDEDRKDEQTGITWRGGCPGILPSGTGSSRVARLCCRFLTTATHTEREKERDSQWNHLRGDTEEECMCECVCVCTYINSIRTYMPFSKPSLVDDQKTEMDTDSKHEQTCT